MHQSWCLKNDIIIYFQPYNFYEGRIVIQEKGRTLIQAETYIQPNKKRKLKVKEKAWWQEVMNLYTSKYLEYNN